MVTSRHADGRETAPKDLPLARQFETATAMRAEEIVLSMPDGSVRALLNVTPIRSQRGDVVPQMLRYVRDLLTVAGYNAVVTGDAEGLSGLIRKRNGPAWSSST